MQITLRVNLDKFQNALGLARRASNKAHPDDQRVHQIDTSVSPTHEIVSQVASAYWDWRNSQRPVPAHVQGIEQFETEECKIRLCYYGDEKTASRAVGGYIVLHGELLAFHNHIRGSGLWMLDQAINDGAVKLSCFDVPHLIKLYQSRGFVEEHREWNTTRGKPDVVWMVKK